MSYPVECVAYLCRDVSYTAVKTLCWNYPMQWLESRWLRNRLTRGSRRPYRDASRH